MKKMMRAVMACTVIVVMTFTSCSKDDDAVPQTTYTISGNASGSQMVPSVAGNGGATISGTYNPATGVMNYTTNWNGMSGAPTSAGFYGGASGTNGTAIGSPWTMGTGWTGTGSTTGTMTLNSEQSSQMLNGNMYYTMGTAANTGGELRGQMTATANP
jgi:hypothetical protein